ncbi:hypothetical protein ABIE64_000178 [Thalassospira sp. MBR-102]|jgi:hypothetical protein
MLGDFFSRVVFIDISQERVEILRFYRHDVSCGVCCTVDWIPAFAGMTVFLGSKVFPSVRHSRAGGSPWGGGRGGWFCYSVICHLA